MNIRNLIQDKLKKKSDLIKNAIHDVNTAPGAWQTLDFLNPSYAVIDFADDSLDTLSIEWYADWVKLQIAYLIAADIVEDIDDELGFDFDASEYSEKVMRMTLKEVKKMMPSIKALEKHYKEFLKEAKECCHDEFEENKENISVKSFKKLYEANKYFFGTEDSNEVKKLFESVSDEKALYKEICQIFVERAGFEYLDDNTAVPNMFTGPCIMKTDKYTHIIGFGAFAKSKGYKTGTKVDKLKIHVITDRKLKHSYPHTNINSGHIEPEEIGESLNFIPTYNSDCANILCDEAVYFDLIEIMKNEGIIDKLNMLFPILDKHHYGI